MSNLNKKNNPPISIASLHAPVDSSHANATKVFDTSAAGLVQEQDLRIKDSARNAILLNAILSATESTERFREEVLKGNETLFLQNFIQRHGIRPQDINEAEENRILDELKSAEPPSTDNFTKEALSSGNTDSIASQAFRGNGRFSASDRVRFDGSAESAIAIIIQKEGGFSDHVRDSGGRTYMGIASNYWGRDFNNIMHIRNTQGVEAARAYAADFYQRNFWNPVERMVESRFGYLPEAQKDALKFVAFDAAVNGGHGLASRLLNRSDGDIEGFMNARLAHLQGLSNWDAFGRGWTNRVNGIAGQALGFLQSGPAPAIS